MGLYLEINNWLNNCQEANLLRTYAAMLPADKIATGNHNFSSCFEVDYPEAGHGVVELAVL